MLLVDAVYLNSFGGKTILELVIKKLQNLDYNCYFILDSRLKSNLINSLEAKNFTVIDASHKNRKFFYYNNLHKFSSILCLSNVPPPLKNSVKTYIFFHNNLLLNPFSHPISFKSRVFNFFKFNYIKYYNNEDYYWIVQTPIIYKSLKKNLFISTNQVYIYPIIDEKSILVNEKKSTNNFIYVSSGVSHKNHIRLIKAFIEVSAQTDKDIKLHLTLNKEYLPKNIYPTNLKVKFHGTLSLDDVNELYNSCEFAIYPSLVESFGLPLVEAANYSCKVIASDLPYVHEIINPSLTFDPYSVESISDSILKAINEDLPETKVLVENKLDNFIDFIISQDVQQ